MTTLDKHGLSHKGINGARLTLSVLKNELKQDLITYDNTQLARKQYKVE